MRKRRIGPVVAGVSALLVTAGVLAAFGGLSGGQTSNHSNAAPNLVSGQPQGTATDECPTADEIRAYWEKYGKDLKPAATCGDPDPMPEGDDTTAEEHADAASPPEPATEAEAQAMLDPTDDPLTLLVQDESGQWSSILAVMAPGQKPPPPNVQTVKEFSAWLDTQGAS